MYKLDHVALNVKNLKRAVKWYTEKGFAVEYEDETWAMLKLNDFCLALTIPDQHPPHIAFTVDDIHEMPGGEIREHRDGSKYLYCDDSEGNTIEYIFWPDGKAPEDRDPQ